MNLDEAYEEFSRIADRWENSAYLAGEMTYELDNLVFQMRSLAPVDRGRLKSSISLLAQGSSGDLSVVLSMLDYGYYQNFGVKPSAQSPINRLSSTMAERRQPYGVPTPSGVIGDFSYSNRRFGLPATVFFDYNELRDQIAIIAESNILEIINDTE